MSRTRFLWAAATAAVIGCGGVTEIPGGDGGQNGGPTGGGGGSGGSGGATTTSTPTFPPGVCAGVDPGIPPSPCTPLSPKCNLDTNPCLALHEMAAAPQFDLRVARFDVLAPPGLANPVTAPLLASAAVPSAPECHQGGDGLFSWILSFDSDAGTFTTGTALPQEDMFVPFTMANLTLEGEDSPISVAPAQGPLSLDASCGFSAGPVDVNLFVFIDPTGSGVLLPFRQLQVSGVVSQGHNCIGTYIDNGCEPGSGSSFEPGAKATALISLADADNFVVSPLAQSVCVLLTSDPGDGGLPKRCAKDANGAILAKGDACLATGGPATPDCADALFFEADLAANAVLVAP